MKTNFKFSRRFAIPRPRRNVFLTALGCLLLFLTPWASPEAAQALDEHVDRAVAAGRPARFASGEEVVAWLYRDFGWECLIARYFEADILVDQPAGVLERYFVPALAARIARDRAFAAGSGEVGRIDFVFLFGSQDPDGACNLRIERLPGTGAVKAVYDQNDERDICELRFDTVETGLGWRVADIHYRFRESAAGPGLKFSLLELLSRPGPGK